MDVDSNGGSCMVIQKRHQEERDEAFARVVGLADAVDSPSMVSSQSMEVTQSTKDKLQRVVIEEGVNAIVGERQSSCNTTKDSNLVESKYRFYNRRRPGSVFTISERNYRLIKKGKVIKFVNQMTGEHVVIRAAKDFRKSSDTNSKTKEQVAVVCPVCPVKGLVERNLSKEISDPVCLAGEGLENKASDVESMEVSQSDYVKNIVEMDRKENDMLKEIERLKGNEEEEQQTSMFQESGKIVSFNSRCNYNLAKRILRKAKLRKRRFNSLLRKNRIKEAKCSRSGLSCSNIDFDCRVKNARKRKVVLSRAEVFSCPRKRISRSNLWLSSSFGGLDDVVNMNCNSGSRVGEA